MYSAETRVITSAAVRVSLARHDMKPFGASALQNLGETRRLVYIVDDFLKNSKKFHANAPDLIRLDGRFEPEGIYSREGAEDKFGYVRLGDLSMLLEQPECMRRNDICVRLKHVGVQHRFRRAGGEWTLMPPPKVSSNSTPSRYCTPANLYTVNTSILPLAALQPAQ